MSINGISDALSRLANEDNEEARLSVATIIRLHDDMIELFGGQLGIRDEGLLELLAEAPYQVIFGTTPYPTLFDKASKYLFEFANHQVFFDGNKRTALAVSALLLEANGFRYKEDFDTKAYCLVLDIANHKYDKPEDVVDIIKDNCRLMTSEEIQKFKKRTKDNER